MMGAPSPVSPAEQSPPRRGQLLIMVISRCLRWRQRREVIYGIGTSGRVCGESGGEVSRVGRAVASESECLPGMGA
jgi:hypothetical protein